MVTGRVNRVGGLRAGAQRGAGRSMGNQKMVRWGKVGVIIQEVTSKDHIEVPAEVPKKRSKLLDSL
jgi:hypothetical protein